MTIGLIAYGNLTPGLFSSLELASLEKVLESLSRALDAGNMPAAQSALNDLRQQLDPGSATANQVAPAQSPESAAALNTLSTALSSGNLADARQALASLLQSLNRDPAVVLAGAALAAKQAEVLIEDRVDLSGGIGTPAAFDPVAQALATAYFGGDPWSLRANASTSFDEEIPVPEKLDSEDESEGEESPEDEPEQDETESGEQGEEKKAEAETYGKTE